MGDSLKFISVCIVGGLLMACSTNTAPISKMSVKGGDYENGLHKGYIKLANAEHAESDWSDGNKFAERAKLAAMGKPPSPEMLSARAIPKTHMNPHFPSDRTI